LDAIVLWTAVAWGASYLVYGTFDDDDDTDEDGVDLNGTDGADNLVGTDDNDQINGGGGEDDLIGKGGGDALRAMRARISHSVAAATIFCAAH